MSSPTLTGGCLCGSVRFELSGPINVVNMCHCSRCRKRGGSAFATVVHARLSHFKFVKGEDHIQLFEPEGWNKRRFCMGCGSPLPGWDEEDDEVGIPAGLFDEGLATRPGLHIMTDSKAAWYDIADDIEQFQAFPPDW
jgi:hypothetical protein